MGYDFTTERPRVGNSLFRFLLLKELGRDSFAGSNPTDYWFSLHRGRSGENFMDSHIIIYSDYFLSPGDNFV